MLSSTEKVPVVKLNSSAVDNFLKQFQLKSATKPSLELLKELPRKSRSFKCKVCERTFTSITDLTEHEKVHTDENPLKCDVCDKAFIRSSNLKRHLATHKNTNSNTKSQKCRYCDYAFASKVILDRHEKLHLNFREFIKVDDTNKRSDKEINVKCSLCKKEFLRSEIHVIGNAYKCKECAKEMLKPGKIIRQEFVYIVGDTSNFLQNESEENALEDIYTPVKSYECDVCEKSFTNQKDLEHHRTISHEKKTLKPLSPKAPVKIPQIKLTPIKIPQIKLTPVKIPSQHKCSKCNRNFTTKFQLNEHMRTHSNDKSFNCSFCSLKFSRIYNLKRHEKTHQKIFKCEQCMKCFTNKEEFERHKHHKEKKYKCDMCEKQFSKRRLLKKHKLLHIGIQFFECKLCEKLFSQEKFLETHHNLAHNDTEEKIQCIICDDAFTSEDFLKEHVSNVHV